MEDFFDLSKPITRNIQVSGINVTYVPEPNRKSSPTRRPHYGTEYAEICRENEMEDFKLKFDQLDTTSSKFGTAIEDRTDERESSMSSSSKFKFNKRQRKDLPIYKHRHEIIDKINNNPVVVLTGSTGCGKSTQIPQYIIDDAKERNVPCRIIVTQPRKIAAITIAQRVAKERNCELGTLVGYQVGLNKKVNECENNETKLLFCTTGVILSKLVSTKEMNKYTHIILDEVHERDIDMDFLLIVVKRLLALNSKNTKVILMSATVDAKMFADYFSYEMNNIFGPAKVFQLEPCMNFDVTFDYLENLQFTKFTEAVIDYFDPKITDKMYLIAQRVVMITLRTIRHSMTNTLEAPSILVFLPGIHEIEHFHRLLNGNAEIESNSKICVLHSTLSTQEQKIAFTSTTMPKIILSTNIAESSVTIPDIEYVVDFCLTKYLTTASGSNMSTLQTDWASKQNCKQRAGRVGRVSPGRVYRLVHKNFYDKQMSKYSVAEMLRIPLETVVLKTKILDMGSPASILALALDPPPLSNIFNSILLLKELGALLRLSENGTFDREDGELTYIGTIMAALPLDVRVSKLIVLGYLFSVLDETVIIGAGLNIKSIFRHMYQKKMDNYSHKLNWADGSGCDCISILNAYKLWSYHHEQGLFLCFDAEREWCKRFNLEERNLYEMRDLIKEIEMRLHKVKIEVVNGPLRVHWVEKEKPFIIKMCIAGAFLPFYFTQNTNDDHMEREVCKTLSNLQPHNTVYFKNMNNNILGTLYQNQIKQYFVQNKVCSNPDNIKVTFDLNKSQKVFVTFFNGNTLVDDGDARKVGNGNVVCGKILPEVYKSVNLRRLFPNFKLHTMDRQKTINFALESNFGSLKDGVFTFHEHFIKRPDLCVLPTSFMHKIEGIVTNIHHANKFHFQPSYSKDTLFDIENEIGSIEHEVFDDLESVVEGMMVIVSAGNGCRRGKVVKASNIQKFYIYLIDYGSVVTVEVSKPLNRFYSVPLSMKRIFEYPPQCFECTLSEIQPSYIKCPKEKWTNETVEVFKQLINKQEVTIDVYSVIDDVVSVQMTVDGININDKLIKEKFAMPCEESYASKMDKDMRERLKTEKARSAREEYATKEDKNIILNMESPQLSECLQFIQLNGPFSPLESQLYGVTRRSTKVQTDYNSCNSIILDTNLNNGHGKLFVATNVSKNQRNCDTLLRQITMMPNIPGLAVLLGMIFCPTMEIRRDENKTRYVSVLTGLGHDEVTNEPLFAEHDCIFQVDVELSPEDDLGLINQLRYSMSYLLLTTPNEEFPTMTDQQKGKLLLKIKDLILKIMSKERQLLESYSLTDSDCWEGEIEDCLKRINIFGHRGIYKFHDVPFLHMKTQEQIMALKEHSEELKKIAMMGISTRIDMCKLCNTYFDNVPELRIHLLSKRHKNREKQLEEEE